MEDFGPVLWILIAGAAMAYSAASNAKKQAQKAKKTPHQEARPTQTAEKTTSAMPNSPEARRFNTLESEPWSFDQEYEEENVSEIQSLETPESETSGNRNAAPNRFTSLNGNTATKQAPTPVKLKQTPSEPAAGQEEAPAEIAEEFDLRKAVIYSEILKPKFDE